MADESASGEYVHPSDWSLFRRVAPYMWRHAVYFAVAIVLAPVSASLAVAQPYLIKVALDDYIAVGDLAGTRNIALMFLGAVLLSWVTEAIYLYVLSVGSMRTITDLRVAVYRHTIRLSTSFFDKQPKGRLLTRVTSDIEALGETLTAGAVTIVLDVLNVTGVLVAMLLLNAELTLVMLLMTPVIVLVVEVLRRILRRLYLEIRTALTELNAFTAERINGLEIVQLYGDEARSSGMYRSRLVRYRDATIRTNVYDAALYAIIDGLSSITIALMLWYGSGGVAEGVFTAGLLAAFIEYIRRLYRPIQEFSAKVAVFQRATTAMQKIFGLMDVDERISGGEEDAPAEVGRIQARDLKFSYGDGPEILKGISFDLAPGEVVALVGRTGSGKTTIGRVLTRTYQGYSGSVTVGGVELDRLDPRDVRGMIGTVLQDVQLFPGTVRFNLTMGRQVEDSVVEEAVRLANAEEVVERLGGLDGMVVHRGGNVSVGESQLLSFARTLLYDAPVVIMDEATANVDTLTEAKIQAATEALFSRKTVLVIAHRLSTIVGADRIYVLDSGQVLESGTHQQLIDRGGAYAALFAQQFAEQH